VSERAGQGRRALDEALRLLDVLQAARPPGPDGPPGNGSPEPAAAAAHAGSECALCPVCRGIAHLRRADPDAVDRIAGAVAELGAALRDLLGGPVPAPGHDADDARDPAAGGVDPAATATVADDRHPPVHHVDVQRIDVTDA
jgi:hypothetical protein